MRAGNTYRAARRNAVHKAKGIWHGAEAMLLRKGEALHYTPVQPKGKRYPRNRYDRRPPT